MEARNTIDVETPKQEAAVMEQEVALVQKAEELKPIVKDMENAAGPSGGEDELLGMRVAELNLGTSLGLVKEADNILPEELWKVLFEYLSDPNDLWNLCNTCKLFEEILHDEWKTGWMLEQALPHLYKYLCGNTLLKCRGISKGWNGAVDSFLENHPSLRPHTNAGDSRRLDIVNPMVQLQIGRKNCFHFYTDTGSRKFIMREFPREEDRNPFLGRSVAFTIRLFEDSNPVSQQEWYGRLCDFLVTYGKEIWYLYISFRFIRRDWGKRMTFDFLTQKLFQLCPNLRSLRTHELGSVLGNSVFIAFDPQLLPDAPKLETLTAGLDNGIIFNTLLHKYRRQLQKVDVPEGVWRSICRFDWSALKELVLNYFNADVVNKFLGEAVVMPVNLTKLGLIYWNEEGKRMQLEPFVEFINKVSATTRLNTLLLMGDQAPCTRQQNTAGVPFVYAAESVKTLELVYYRYSGDDVAKFPADSYDFLTHFAFVENVNVRFINQRDVLRSREECKMIEEKLTDNQEGEEILEVIKYMFKGGMYKSNIWKKLRALKVFTFQWDVYTREGYEAYLNGRAF